MRRVLEKHSSQLSEVRLEEFDVRLLHHGIWRDKEEKGAGAPVRVLALFSDGQECWGTVGVAADILQASVACIIDGFLRKWRSRTNLPAAADGSVVPKHLPNPMGVLIPAVRAWQHLYGSTSATSRFAPSRRTFMGEGETSFHEN